MIDLLTAAETLSRCALFSDLPPETLVMIARELHSRRFRRDEVMFHEGDRGDALYVVLSGSVKIVLSSNDADEAILATLKPGDFLGELALIDGADRSATAIAMEATETLELSRDRFRELIEQEPGLRDALLVGLTRELRRLTTQVGELHFLDLTGRITARLIRLAAEQGERMPDGSIRLDGPITQGDLASMVGSTRQSVSKLMHGFVEDGLLRQERDSIVILDIERLSRASLR